MKKRVSGAVFILAFWLAGCAHIPPAAIDVSRQVSSGIGSLNDNGQELIRAWEETAYMVLDEKWGKVYTKTESSYRTKRGIQAGTALTNPQLEEVAGLAALVRDEVRKKIRDQSESMKKIVASNAKTTLEANESVTNLLISANSITTMQQSALKQVGELLPIPATVSTFIKTALAAAGLETQGE